MIGHALSLAAHDLLIGFLVITAIGVAEVTLWCTACLLAEHYAAKHPIPPAHFGTERRHRPVDPIDLSGEINAYRIARDIEDAGERRIAR